jgi:hypothetical protein
MGSIRWGKEILVDTPAAKFPLKRWLLLGLLVLLAHLGLLQSMPLSLRPDQAAADPVMRFATRAIALPPALKPAPVRPAAALPTRPRLRQPPQAVPPPANTESAALPDAPSDSADNRDFGDAADLPAAAPAADAADAVSAGQVVAAPPEAFEPPPVPRPPRARPPAFHSAALTTSTRLLYQVHSSKFPLTLNGELLWRNLGRSYAARLSFSAFGLSRSQTSRGQISEAGLAPERFADKYRTEVAAHFNYPLGLVTFSANTPDAPLLTGAQDRLSVLIQLGALVASEPERYGPGMTLTIQTIGPRDADLWLFTFEAAETLELPGGTLQGIKLVRNPRQPYDQKVEVWLAPRLGYLPARIRITETSGESIDQQWSATESADGAD